MIRHLPQGVGEYKKAAAARRTSARAALVPGLVAAALIALAVADGGYPTGVVAGTAMACWWLVFAAVALRLLPFSSPPRAALLAGGLLLSLTALTAISMAWSEDDGAAYEAAVLASLYLGIFAAVVLASRPASARSWLAGLTLGLGVICLLALASHWFGGLEDERIASSLPDAAERLNFPIGYWNSLAATLALFACLLAWLSFGGRSALSRSLATAALILPALGIFLTSSRGGVVAAAAGLLALLVCTRQRPQLLASLLLAAPGCAAVILLADDQGTLHGSEGVLLFAVMIAAAGGIAGVRYLVDRPLGELRVPRGLAWAATGLAVLLLAAAAVASDPGERWDSFRELPQRSEPDSEFVASHLASESGSGRYQFWSTAVDAFEEEPIGGIGAGGYEAWWNERASFEYRLKNAHSLFFETLAELGAIGLALVVGLFTVTAVAGVRRLRDDAGEVSAGLALVAAGAVAAGIDWSWQVPATIAPVIVAMALLTGPATLARREGEAAAPASSSGRGWGAGRVATLAVALVLAGAAALLTVAEVQLERSRDQTRELELEEAARSARSAAALEPWAAAPHLQLALVAERAGDFATARQEIGDAIERDPRDWSLWLVRARLETRSGNVARGRVALARSRELNPFSPVFRLLDQPG